MNDRHASTIERLENRCFLSATLKNGVLRVNGDATAANNIAISLNDDSHMIVVTINGASAGTFDPAKVKAIYSHGGSGNDTISVSADINPRIALFGEDGNDTLTGGGGSNFLRGGAGDDQIQARGKRNLIDAGATAIVIKGIQQAEQHVDLFFDGREFLEFAAPSQPNNKTHGSGCAFSAAITAGLANRLTLVEAIDQAKQLVTMAIQYSDGQGRGTAPVNVLAFAPKKK